jgi:hypothetical protein
MAGDFSVGRRFFNGIKRELGGTHDELRVKDKAAILQIFGYIPSSLKARHQR